MINRSQQTITNDTIEEFPSKCILCNELLAIKKRYKHCENCKSLYHDKNNNNEITYWRILYKDYIISSSFINNITTFEHIVSGTNYSIIESINQLSIDNYFNMPNSMEELNNLMNYLLKLNIYK